MIIIQREDKVIANQLCQQINDTHSKFISIYSMYWFLSHPFPKSRQRLWRMPQPFAVLEAKDSPGGFLRDLVELSGERSPGGPAEDNGQKPGKGPLRGSWEEQERLCRSYTKTLPHTSGETEAQEIKGSGFPLPGSPPRTLAAPPGSSHYCSAPTENDRNLPPGLLLLLFCRKIDWGLLKVTRDKQISKPRSSGTKALSWNTELLPRKNTKHCTNGKHSVKIIIIDSWSIHKLQKQNLNDPAWVAKATFF